MKTLILLTNFFPYGNGEPYLETEVQYFERYFDRIYVASLQLRGKDLKSQRRLPSDRFNVLPVAKAANRIYLMHAVRAFADKNLYVELWRLFRQGRLSFRRVINLFVYLSRSYYEARHIVRWLHKEGVLSSRDNGVIYSYRFEYQPYVGLILKKLLPRFKTVSRGHRFDLYEERRKGNYIPLRPYLLKQLDHTIMIAKNGIDYLAGKYPKYRNKLMLSRLGVMDHGLGPQKDRSDRLNIISCSTITSVKRVNLIVKALSHINNIKIHWDHYGEGVLAEEVKTLAAGILPNNISYNFHGYIDNQDLLKIYQSHPYHIFINVSSSEGIPVSIMEAMSFGIPCIATDVGGTNEIVENEYNGILLPCDFNVEDLAHWISTFASMSDAVYSNYRTSARSTWATKYSAEKNYSEFLSFLSK